ncbi:OLC1v1038487C1 [Oldenlandia corymbosa var. corymbosa]|uniref:OLC1v1038487C1 n=1 Tax=Oldenlandia corymbosa var. corymbosa TaxID=529605 RepID=A0AAV1D009_OLDCO|nr:OLC1v1038487C1 [Oldenlandia corymbosa var. corymbosa]
MASPRMGTGGCSRSGWFRFRYDEDQETPTDTRNVLLIVVALIAAVTFQAGVNPPGGVWQDNAGGHKAGRAIYADQKPAFYVFLIANTLALSTAILILISLTYKFPFNLEIWIATLSMFATYASAIFAIAPDESIRFRYVLCAAGVPFGIQMMKKLYQWSMRSK